jgi:hypothetical protein
MVHCLSEDSREFNRICGVTRGFFGRPKPKVSRVGSVDVSARISVWKAFLSTALAILLLAVIYQEVTRVLYRLNANGMVGGKRTSISRHMATTLFTPDQCARLVTCAIFHRLLAVATLPEFLTSIQARIALSDLHLTSSATIGLGSWYGCLATAYTTQTIEYILPRRRRPSPP